MTRDAADAVRDFHAAVGNEGDRPGLTISPEAFDHVAFADRTAEGHAVTGDRGALRNSDAGRRSVQGDPEYDFPLAEVLRSSMEKAARERKFE